MILLKPLLIERLLQESVVKDHKVLHAIAEDVFKEFKKDPKALPMIDVNPAVKMSPFEYKLTPEKLEKIASKFDISSTFKSIIDNFKNEKRPDETILIIYLKNIANSRADGQYYAPGVVDYARIVLNTKDVPYATDQDMYKWRIVHQFSLANSVIEHELQHWYDGLRVKSLNYVTNPYEILYKKTAERGLVDYATDPQLYKMYREIPGEIWANASGELKRIYESEPTFFLKDYFLDGGKRVKAAAINFYKSVLYTSSDLQKDKSKNEKLKQRLIKLYFKVVQNRVEELAKDPFTKAIIDLLKKGDVILVNADNERYKLESSNNLFSKYFKEDYFIKKGNVYRLKDDVELTYDSSKSYTYKNIFDASALLGSYIAKSQFYEEDVESADYFFDKYKQLTAVLAKAPSLQNSIHEFAKALGIENYKNQYSSIKCPASSSGVPVAKSCIFYQSFSVGEKGELTIGVTENPNYFEVLDYSSKFGDPDSLDNLIQYCINLGLNVDIEKVKKAFSKISQALDIIKKGFNFGVRKTKKEKKSI